MNIYSALAFGRKKIKMKKILQKTAALDSEILLSHALKQSKEFLYTYPEVKISSFHFKKYLDGIKRRLLCEPISYITGKKEFYNRDFYVNHDVFIPRPETETLIDEVMRHINENPLPKIIFAEIGTGSGCISITLQKELYSCGYMNKAYSVQTRAYATDSSPKALRVAKRNTKLHGAHIHFLRGNLFQPLKGKTIDILIANLPYLNPKIQYHSRPFLRYEPREALYASVGGLGKYFELFRQMNLYKIYPSLVVCEIMSIQKKNMESHVKKILKNYSISFVKDLGQKIRLAKLIRKN